MVDIDATPGPAGNKKNEPENKFEFYVAEFKSLAEPILEELAKWMAYKIPYDEQRQILENETQVSRATELAKEIGKFIGPKGKIAMLYKTHIAPLDDTLKTIKGLRDGFAAAPEQFDGELRARINVYQQKQRAAQLKKEADDKAKAAALAATGKPEAIQQAAEILSKPAERAGTVRSDHGSQAGYAVKWDIQSIEDGALPVEYKSPDLTKIRARIATMTEAEKRTPMFIPGVILVEKLQTRLS